jgi:copper chaperone CopZ
MKKLLLLSITLMMGIIVLAQNPTKTTFTVSGNCDMCKATIEKAAKSVAGVSTAVWDKESKKLNVSYDTTKTKVDDIHKAIAKSGYDTDKQKATDEAYNSLHTCCKYRKTK